MLHHASSRQTRSSLRTGAGYPSAYYSASHETFRAKCRSFVEAEVQPYLEAGWSTCTVFGFGRMARCRHVVATFNRANAAVSIWELDHPSLGFHAISGPSQLNG